MKIFLSGYGRMGKMIETLALEQGWEILGHADITCPENYHTAPRADVCIDVSAPAALPRLADYIRRAGTPLLSGTTGYAEPELPTWAMSLTLREEDILDKRFSAY